MSDPYELLNELTANAQIRTDELRRAAQSDEPLVRHSTRNELRVLADDVAEAMRRLVALLDWVEESDLPPGLRTWVERTGASELTYDPATGAPAAIGSPGELEEPLPALAYSSHMGGELFDMVRLDVSALGPPRPRGRETPDSVLLDGPEASVRVRGTTELQRGDEEGPDEPATLYVSPAGARRLAAKLRRAAGESERQLREGS